MIKRIYNNLEDLIEPNKVLIIFGPRRVGKTTLVKSFLERTSLRYRFDNGDNIDIQEILSSRRLSLITEYVGDKEIIVIDEAQNIPYIGKALKLIVDSFPGIKVIATGSSSFDLTGQIGEPLVERKTTITLFPLSAIELLPEYNNNGFDFKKHLNEFLTFGSYPSVVTSNNLTTKKDTLHELVNSYLLKDILALDNIKDSKFIRNLLKLLAYQIGNEVSQTELATQLGVNVKTVARYLDLLEKTFVIYPLGGYSRNLRNEITSKNKYFFFDNGIRNAIIDQFNSIDLRNDIGQLWENYLMGERMKKRLYKGIYGSNYFWRTYEKHEIDLIEDREAVLHGFEFKWAINKKPEAPREWVEAYPHAVYQVINRENFLDFIS